MNFTEGVNNMLNNDEAAELRGTITWFECDKLPPVNKAGLLCSYSEYVFILLDHKQIIKTKAVFEKSGEFIAWENNGTPYNPTHWAYINYPE